MNDAVILTYRYRVKDKRAKRWLKERAWAANQVWNFCVETQRKAERRWKAGSATSKWPTHFDLTYLTAGSSTLLDIPAETIGEVCRQFCISRKQARHAPKFRASGGPRRALGWIPFRGRTIQCEGNSITFYKKAVRLFGIKSRSLPANIKTGAFVEDALGRWWACLTFEAPDLPAAKPNDIGIDLGLLNLAVLSDGTRIANPQSMRLHQEALATAQRAGNRRRRKAIHLKIANVRKDWLHKASFRIARDNRLIVVGDVNASRLKKTRLAKSVSDAGWTMFRKMLEYKASRRRASFSIVNEAWTSRTCSSCGIIPDSSPKGMGALGIRAWRCEACGADHDRDHNAAINILKLGLAAQPRADESREIAQ